MRLTHIKLSGFKSFVDPTTIAVPGQLVAVIGPNGCGKSNVIDAVRWVLGESSAKQLRGESMQDVIFNGSSNRKPVSRASVELIFDNSDNALSGAWGQYGEVAIKRVLTRQGESSYYINNQQVRRRDITDLFLGTGVGARGYAVIEQGMISRIIEARPEELRAYLEEAAGVSKYKERRRETEHRLADTRANLERIGDLQQELERQVVRLSEQAELAARYQDLRASLSHKQNLLALARREEAARDEAQARIELARLSTKEAALAATVTRLESETNTIRESHFAANDALHSAQQQLAETNAQLARMEEAQRHQEQNRSRIEREQLSISEEQQRVTADLRQIATELEEWQPRHEEAQLQLEETQLALLDGNEQLPQVEAEFRAKAELFQQQSTRQTELVRERDLSRQQLGHLQQTLQQLTEREQALQRELADLNLPDQASQAAVQQQVIQARQAVETVRARLVADEEKQAEMTTAREQIDEQLHQQRSELAHAEAQAAALNSLLQREAADEQLQQWLQQNQLSEAPQLWQAVQIDEHWQLALEAALGERLNARAAALPTSQPPAGLTLIDQQDSLVQLSATPWPSLLSLLTIAPPFTRALHDWLSGVYLANDLASALSQRQQLSVGECLLTPEGHRIYASNISWYAKANSSGIMARKTQLTTAKQTADSLQASIAKLIKQREAQQSQAAMLTEAIRAQRNNLTRQEAELNALTLEQVKLEQAAHQGANRLAAMQRESQQIQNEREQTQQRIADTQIQQEESNLALEELGLQLEDLRLARLNAETGVELARHKARDAERIHHQIQLELHSAEQKTIELGRRQNELSARQQQLAERQTNLLAEAENIADVIPAAKLNQALQNREQGEQQLSSARDQLNYFTETLRTLAQQQQTANTTLPALREAHSAYLLKHQEARLAMERFSEELSQAGADEASLLSELSDAIKPNILAAEIGRLARALENMGAVNLAALEELQAAQQRGDYLSNQADDLNQAMSTLETAMAKIDNETRDMLQATYDAVNAKMREFFPTLFGGGRAELVLTGDDLLDAGVQIIAQPPGKKNSTIHLLSGGEKALTAVSLVFSLFSLNPAPFCLLDEVDAPLDDANTGRFCELVKQMSQRTQFLYISHNRLTMEMAEQLVGVTMQEQGVSRIVAVDIVAALQLRETT
ncbi:chromosome segregation protein SMC [Neisseriaceae bacterium TC5R-5]|nr:chromosome segregation protein SMC [Neisseriaceae bacterium TC5R-5]